MAKFTYKAIVYKQRATAELPFVIFSAKAGEIQLWATVNRLEPNNKQGIQRARKDPRVDAVADFFIADERNTIPTSIVVSIPFANVESGVIDLSHVDTTPQTVEININTDDKQPQPGLIIDGQHRTFGIAQFDPNTPVNVVAILGPSDDEIAFQFIVINNKGAKVSPDHIKALKLGYSEANLDKRLTKSARIKSSGRPAYLEDIDENPKSPFKGLLKWPRNEIVKDKSIVLNAFEMALMHIANQRIEEVPEGDASTPDFVVRFFLEIWITIQEVWPSLWVDPASKLLKKVGVVCMTEFLVDTMIQWSMVPMIDQNKIDLTNLNDVSTIVRSILNDQLEMAFWTSEWDDASLDTKNGRELLVSTLKSIQINKSRKLPWNNKLKLITGSMQS